MLAGRAIYSREMAQLFKELEAWDIKLYLF
jgi:hypothetical protein